MTEQSPQTPPTAGLKTSEFMVAVGAVPVMLGGMTQVFDLTHTYGVVAYGITCVCLTAAAVAYIWSRAKLKKQ